MPQYECLVSEVGLQKLCENGRQLLEVAAGITGGGGRGDDFLFFGDHHFGLHPITFGDCLTKVWGPLM